MAGPIIVPSGSAPSSVVRSLYRRSLMKRLGPGVVYTTTSVSTEYEALSHVIVARLINNEGSLERYAGRHLYVATGVQAGHQTCVLSAGSHGPSGLLEVTSPFTTALAAGVEIELSATLPAESYEEWPSLNEIVNETLDALPVHVDSDFTFVARQVRYDLSGLPWRFRREDVLDVYPPIPSGFTAAQILARPISRGLWSVEYDGASPYLQLRTGFADAETFFVRLSRPASSYINSGSAWGDSSTGLTSDTQEALYDVDTVVDAALPIACERLETYWREQGDDAKADRWMKRGDELATGALLARFHRSFQGNGIQRVGAIGAR